MLSRCLAQLYNLNRSSNSNSNNNTSNGGGFACVFKTYLTKWPRRQRNTYTPRCARVLPATEREKEREGGRESGVLLPFPSYKLLLPALLTLFLILSLSLSVSLSLSHLFCLCRTAVRAAQNHFNRLLAFD